MTAMDRRRMAGEYDEVESSVGDEARRDSAAPPPAAVRALPDRPGSDRLRGQLHDLEVRAVGPARREQPGRPRRPGDDGQRRPEHRLMPFDVAEIDLGVDDL